MKKLTYILLTLPLLPTLARAQENVWNIWRNTTGTKAIGTSTRREIVTCNDADGGCSLNDGITVVLNVLKLLFYAGTFISVIMIIYGAIQMMTAGGSPDKISQAKKTMLYAVVGLIIVLAAVLIVNTVQRIITVREPSGIS